MWIDRRKIALEKKYLEIKNSETCFCCLYAKLAPVKIWEQSNKFPLTCSSLKWPILVKKLFREKQRWKNFPASQTNSTHKHSQLGSQITEPISTWKVYFHWLPGEISPPNLQSTLSVSHYALKNIFGCFFLPWSCWSKMRKITKGTTARKKTKATRRKNQFSTKKTKRQLQMNR